MTAFAPKRTFAELGVVKRGKALSVLVVLALGVGFSQGHAQEPRGGRLARIATLDDGNENTRPHLWASFRARLKELGYIEGKNFVLESRWANGDRARIPILATELVALKPDVIVTASTPPALAMKNATTQIPIVALAVANPVRSGLVASFSRPEGNLTGVTTISTDIAGKWLELLREIAPDAKSLAFLGDTTSPGTMGAFREVQEHAKALGIAVQAMEGRSARDVDNAFRVIAHERIQGIIVAASGVLLEQQKQIIDAAARQRLPAVYGRGEYAHAGGLASYGTDQRWLFARGAEYVHRILMGARPSELPFEQASTFRLVVNLRTAKALGIKIPQSVLLQADEVLE